MFIRRLVLGLALSVLALAAAPLAAGAATVSNTNDSGEGSLRQAIFDAAPGATISVPPGEYVLTSGELVIDKSLTLAGADGDSTVLLAQGPFRVVRVTGAGTQATISGVTIRGGLVSGQTPALGGGVLDEGANLTLKEVQVTDNLASSVPVGGIGAVAKGGGIAATAGSTLTVLDCLVDANVSAAIGPNGDSGGVAEGGGLAAIEATLSVARSSFSGNLADARGGQGPANPAQLGGTAQGGGIFTFFGPTSIVSSTVNENTTDDTAGPGANPASGINEGAGIVLNAEALTKLASSTVDGNVARGGSIESGAGVFTRIAAGGHIALVGDTITANAATAPSGTGGNLKLDPGASVADTIVSGGIGPAGAENCVGAGVSIGFNLESTDQCGFHAPGDIVGKDPLLGPLSNNGGPTRTRRPARNSPAVDGGAAFGAAADQRGLPEPIDFLANPNSAIAGADGGDIGAVELQVIPIVVLGTFTRQRRTGTALLSVSIPDPVVGTLTVSGAGLKTVTSPLTAGSATLKIQPIGSARKALRKRGRRQIEIVVTYSPAGTAVVVATRNETLIQARKRHKHRRHHRGHR